VQMTTSA